MTPIELNKLNFDFYQSAGKYWNNDPNYIWNGWLSLIYHLEKLKHINRPVKILDLGCGNGRFYNFAKQNFLDLQYTGVDFSDYFLTLASKNLSNDNSVKFIKSDLFFDDWNFLKYEGQFDLIVAFGLIHHIPSKTILKDFFRKFKTIPRSKVAKNVLTTWNYHLVNRLSKKIVDKIEKPIGISYFDEQENLLTWDKGVNVLRFSRYFYPDQVLNLLELSKDDCYIFNSDGKTGNQNTYYVF
jgi:SAM-dependent methyltransferase